MRTRIGPEGLSNASTQDEQSGWREQYQHSLIAAGSLSKEAREELSAATNRVFQHIPAASSVGNTHRLAGALVGAVQSGKTGVMIDLAAQAFDRGFRLVIVLAGLRDDLRAQTALRFTADLLCRGDEIYPRSADSRFTHPKGVGYHGPMGDACWSPHYADDINHDEAFVSTIARRLAAGRSVLAVTKKNLKTLNVLSQSVVYATNHCGEGSFPILVIDDECDEASVSGSSDAPTPARIASVWEGVRQYVVYVGLTATPAANLLQNTDTPLFPRDFLEVLRTPSDESTPLAFFEPDPDRRYTGGRVYYQLLEDRDRRNFLLRTAMSQAEFEGAASQPTARRGTRRLFRLRCSPPRVISRTDLCRGRTLAVPPHHARSYGGASAGPLGSLRANSEDRAPAWRQRAAPDRKHSEGPAVPETHQE